MTDFWLVVGKHALGMEIELKRVYTWCYFRYYQKASIASSNTGLNVRILGTNVDTGVDIKQKSMVETSNDSNQCLVAKNRQFWLVRMGLI
jgi:hypothetical protein